MNKMINIRFTQVSLLYGISYIWAAAEAVYPTIEWPDFEETKQRFSLLDYPSVYRIVIDKRFSLFFKLIRCGGISFYILYLTSYISISLEYTEVVLANINIYPDSSLSFKIIYYFPILQVSAS